MRKRATGQKVHGDCREFSKARSGAQTLHCGKKMITKSFQRKILGNIQNINIGKYIIKGPGHSAYAHQTYIYTLYFPIPNAILSI